MKTILALLVFAGAAHADPTSVHFNISSGLAVGTAQNNYVDAVALNPTIHVDLGVRFDPHTAIYGRGEIGSIIFANQAALYLVAEWRPVHWLSLGSGIGWDGIASYGGGGGSTRCDVGPCEPLPKTTWSAISVPVIVGFTLANRESHAPRLELETAGGYESSTNTYGWHASLTFGWTWN